MNAIKNLSTVTALIFGLVFSLQAQVNQINLAQTKGEFNVKSLNLTPGEYQFEIANNGVAHEVGFVLAPKGKTSAEHHIKEAYVTSPVKNGSSSKTNVVTLEAGEYVYFCPLNQTEHYSLTVAEFGDASMLKEVDENQKKMMKGDAMSEKEAMIKKESMMKKEAMMEKEAMMKKESMKKEAMMEKGDAMSHKETKARQIKLVQTKGEFKTKSLNLEAGLYQFEIANMGVGHDVGFVIAPKGQTDASHHIKEAYVTSPVKDGTSSMTNVVSLEPGTYVYFCPLNKTEQYELVVK